MALHYISLGPIFGDTEKDKYVLGKKFSNTIKSKIDQQYVNWCRRKIEEVKLQIIDAAENEKKPPTINDVEWLYKLWYNQPEYKFVAKEFDDWLVNNGLSCSFHGYSEYVLKISLSSFVNFDNVSNPLTIKLDDVLKKRRDNGEV